MKQKINQQVGQANNKNPIDWFLVLNVPASESFEAATCATAPVTLAPRKVTTTKWIHSHVALCAMDQFVQMLSVV